MRNLRRSAAFCIGIGMSLFMTACGGGGSITPPPPTTYTLTVNSASPTSGVAITVSPADNNSAANGTTSFTRTYNAGVSVTLTAPATSGGSTFTSWTGCTTATTVTCTVTMNANTTVTANYPTPVTTNVLTVNSTNPASGVTITASPADNSSKTSGSTGFTLNYNAGTAVTLTAPATSGGNTFTSWTGCTTATTVTCTVTMNANTTVTANYATPVTTYALTVNSTNPASGVAITASPADNSSKTSGSTGFTLSYNAGTAVTLTAPATAGSNTFSSWTGCTPATTFTCTVTMNANTTVTANYATPATTYVLTVDSTNPASGVAITASPADNSSKTSGSTGFTLNYNAGAAVTLTAPATSGGNNFSSWTGCTTATTVTCAATLNANTTVTANYVTPSKFNPTVTVTPSALAITTVQALSVTVGVSGGTSNPTPTGSVVLTGGGYTSAATTLSSGGATINIPAGSLATGSDTLTATYTPDAASSSIYLTSTGTSATVTVTLLSAITVNQSSSGPAVTDQLMGMNMAVWNDTALSAAVSPFQAVGIKAVRWPGGSTSDTYHWEGQSYNTPSSPSTCDTMNNTIAYGYPNDTFEDFINELAGPTAASLDIALTANYGSNGLCNGGGVPSEAAAWVTYAASLGVTVSHMTVGNEEYGHWEYDLHTVTNDPTTYAAAVGNSTSNGYYEQIKAASAASSQNTLVGVDVDAGEPASGDVTAGWDPNVLANSQYDFVEYHYYPQGPGSENDNTLVHSGAQGLTTSINTIKAELSTAGKPTTPIYVGEMGSVSSNPGKQSWSITQALYAGQLLGEMMNDGVSRATWWIGFGNCNGTAGNNSASLYGWQDFGAYNVFSDGTADSTSCPDAGPVGTLSPTAVAYQLFGNVAVNGESVLTAGVTGDTTDVRAYAATHSGGTALVLFNLNETVSEPVTITLSAQTTASSVTWEYYDKAIYDLSGSQTGFFPDSAASATDPYDWVGPTTTTISSPTLPLTLTLAPWSMNVVIIH
jgi:List-Bact-rpt repeat protein